MPKTPTKRLKVYELCRCFNRGKSHHLLTCKFIHAIEKIFTVLHNENDRMLPLTPEQNNIINANLKELEREYQLNHILYHTITAL